MRVLLVASAGGHLTHLHWLRDWWRNLDRTWVTFDLPDADRLEGERVVFAHHPTNRNLPNALRNARLARHVLDSVRPDLVVSSGAGVAVPFLAAARARSIATLFLEVEDRVERPSLSGKLVHRWVDRMIVQCEAQRAHYPQAIVLGPMADRTVRITRMAPAKKVFVTVGTHHQPFARLRDAMPIEATVQAGHTPWPGADPWLTPEAWDHEVRSADAVVCHAAPATVWRCLELGKRPIVVPRRAPHEHVDDHQVAWASTLPSSHADVVDVSDLHAALQRATLVETTVERSRFCRAFGAVARDALRTPGRWA